MLSFKMCIHGIKSSYRHCIVMDYAIGMPLCPVKHHHRIKGELPLLNIELESFIELSMGPTLGLDADIELRRLLN